jgi:hypothetical protein
MEDFGDGVHLCRHPGRFRIRQQLRWFEALRQEQIAKGFGPQRARVTLQVLELVRPLD